MSRAVFLEVAHFDASLFGAHLTISLLVASESHLVVSVSAWEMVSSMTFTGVTK